MSAQLDSSVGHGLDSLGDLTKDMKLSHHEEAPAPDVPATTGDVVQIAHHRKAAKAPARNPRPARPHDNRAPAPRAAEGGQRQRRERAVILLDLFVEVNTNLLLDAIRACRDDNRDAVLSLSMALPGAERTKLEFTLEIVGGDRILMRVLPDSLGLFGALFEFKRGYILFRDEILGDVEVPAKRKHATEGVVAIIQLIESSRNAVRARQEELAQAQAQAKQD